MTICDTVQHQLAEAGVDAADIEDIARHLEGCDDCSKFLADLRTIDAGLIELTSHDAPDALVADTLAAVRAAEQPAAMPARPPQRQRWLARGLAGGAVLAASVALTLTVFDPSQFSAVVATKISSGDTVDRDGNEGGVFGRHYGLQSQKAAEPRTSDAEQVLSESESSSVSGPVGGVLQRRTQNVPDVGDFRAREDYFRYFADNRIIDESAQAKAPQSEEAGAAAQRELDVIAQVAPQDLAHRHAGRTELEQQAGETSNEESNERRRGAGVAVQRGLGVFKYTVQRDKFEPLDSPDDLRPSAPADSEQKASSSVRNREQFEDRSESDRGYDPNARPATSATATVGGKAKSDDDVRLRAGSSQGSVFIRIPTESEPPRSAVVEGQSSSDLSELNKEVPAKNSRTEEVLKQQGQLNSTIGSGAATNGAAANEITRGKPTEQPVSSSKPVEVGEDEKKNRANLEVEERPASSALDLNIVVPPDSGPQRIEMVRDFVDQHLEFNQSENKKTELRRLVQQEFGNARSEEYKAAIREILRDIESEEVGRDKDTSRDVGGAYYERQRGLSDASRRKSELAIDQLTPADRFLAAQRSLDDLIFQEPTGYWANTYIPGDPEIRVLQARLAAWDRTALGQYNRLEQDVRPGVQPFDAPADAAVAVTMASDTTSINGPTRLRVQIGVKGAERLGGRRPAMNIGLVVDIRSLADAETGSRIRALITALERSRQPGDRFSLTVAGPAGGLLVAPEQFRHGPLQVALDRMFNSSNIAGEALSLPAAMGLATENVRAGDNPESILGSSLVMLVTGSSLQADIDALERAAHKNAVGGVPLSVVSLAGQDDLAHIDRLVAAGQGNRRVLDTAQSADGLVDRELHAASRAVARALRLRIRLAPGVKLVSVLDSRLLGEPQAAQVREAEVAIDQRLARNLGIEADRGDDEQGIQMVIPNFFAGDSHTVLLDVVTERAGPIADVTVRYKDVVNLKNGVVQASLALDDTPREAGPLERNVLKNLVAVEFAKQTRLASRELALGNSQRAQQRIIQLREFMQGMRFAVPGWQSDLDLAADEAVLTNYASVLTRLPVNDPGQRQLLADSLRVAAHRKLQQDVPR